MHDHCGPSALRDPNQFISALIQGCHRIMKSIFIFNTKCGQETRGIVYRLQFLGCSLETDIVTETRENNWQQNNFNALILAKFTEANNNM